MVVDQFGRVTRDAAAEALGLSSKTLANRAVAKLPPRCFKVGGRTYYLADDIIAFARGETKDAA